MTNLQESVRAVREKMLAACQKAGQPFDAVRLVAATKTVDVEGLRDVMAMGIADFGENYVQEAREKIEALGPGPTWHMIGHVQANKAKYIPRLFSYVHSIDRWELMEDLDRYEKPLQVLFEVNLSGEPQKHGTDRDRLRGMLERIGGLRFVRPVGLMTMPPATDDPEKTRPYFSALRDLLAEVNREFGLSMTELSMGMSADYAVAIEEGATMVRVGTAIFGERL
ncbi:MAG TPA: YggS family pyridoxal phosphate-dependent enzyme [Syntrophorhabdales bacterium]|nr:YggS family pyridoxal phosphate-dependent enzyme [Syntrophorhabdales bacterium]